VNENDTLPSVALTILPERLAVCRLPEESEFPEWARPGELQVFIRRRDELSVVCAERYVPPEIKAERGWRALQVQGTLDFTLVGILASLTMPLAEAKVSVFSISTYDTDLIMIKEDCLERAVKALCAAGHQVLS
jgi:hypothetical protein